jgi:hypothetical protein
MEVALVRIRALAVLAGAVGFLVWLAIRRPAWMPRPMVDLSLEARRGVEQGAIRWSGNFLRSMGAVESAPRAQQEAMMARRVADAVVERLQAAAEEIRVMVIGGVIHLEGRVASDEARAEAERTAHQVSGARVVADDLHVH